MAQFEFEGHPKGVIPTGAAVPAEGGISRSSAASQGRSLGPLVKARAFGMTPMQIRIQIEPLPEIAAAPGWTLLFHWAGNCERDYSAHSPPHKSMSAVGDVTRITDVVIPVTAFFTSNPM